MSSKTLRLGMALVIAVASVMALPVAGHAAETTLDVGTQANLTLNGAAGLDAAGRLVAGVGDLNDDGYDDVAIAAPDADSRTTFSNSGSVYIIWGPQSAATIDLGSLTPQQGIRIDGPAVNNAKLGSALAGVGDVNSDGIADLLVGSTLIGFSSRSLSGTSYVIYGSPGLASMQLSSSLTATTGFIIGGAAQSGSSTSAAGVGDVNNDTVPDILIGASSQSSNAGAAYVVLGATTATRSTVDLATMSGSSTADGYMITGASGSRFGVAVSGTGDVNDDGINDLLIGGNYWTANSRSQAGSGVIIYGKSSPANVAAATMSSTDGFRIDGPVANGDLGKSVGNVGDFNGDGIDDILVGSQSLNGGAVASGAAFVIYGVNNATRSNIILDPSTPLPTSEGFRMAGGPVTNSAAATSISGLGDVNGDGLADLAVGAPAANYGGSGSGSVYVVFGSGSAVGLTLPDLTAAQGYQINGVPNAAYGTSVTASGNFAGSGSATILSGGQYGGTGYSGAAYVIYPTPAKAASISGQAGNGEATLNWVAPSFTGTDPITGYRVEYSTSPDGPWSEGTGTCNNAATSVSTGLTCTATGLANGTHYYFRVAAINPLGAGDFVISEVLTPSAPPVPPVPSDKLPQIPVNKCVGDRGKIRSTGNKRILQADCVSNAGQPVGAAVSWRWTRGDVAPQISLFCRLPNGKHAKHISAGYGGKFVKCRKGPLVLKTKRIKGLRVTAKWFAPETTTHYKYSQTQVFRA